MSTKHPGNAAKRWKWFIFAASVFGLTLAVAQHEATVRYIALENEAQALVLIKMNSLHRVSNDRAVTAMLKHVPEGDRDAAAMEAAGMDAKKFQEKVGQDDTSDRQEQMPSSSLVRQKVWMLGVSIVTNLLLFMVCLYSAVGAWRLARSDRDAGAAVAPEAVSHSGSAN